MSTVMRLYWQSTRKGQENKNLHHMIFSIIFCGIKFQLRFEVLVVVSTSITVNWKGYAVKHNCVN